MSKQLAHQFSAYGLPVFPVTTKKRPAVKGWQHPLAPNQYQWPSNKVGVPIPAGCFVIDLDIYKGVTRQAVEQVIGCALPWDEALIQTTAGGGEHYAFSHNGDELMQGSDLFKLAGFDSRRAGAGFIVTGEGYTPTKPGGAGALAYPTTLPQLPPAAALKLRKPPRQAEKPTKPLTEQEVENMKSALASIDPACGRNDWWRLLAAARHLTAHDPEQGLEIFNAWSAGEYSTDQEPPANYMSFDDVEYQWFHTGSKGGIAGGTLYDKAMAFGWRPPTDFDVSAVFGKGAAAVDVYVDTIDDINAHALDPKEQPRLIDTIVNFPGSSSQMAALRGLMLKLLKEDNQLTKQLRKMLDGGATRQPVTDGPSTVAVLPDIIDADEIPEKQISRASASHGANAMIMIGEIFGDRVASFNGALRWWSGREWQAIPEEKLKRLTCAALMPEHSKAPNISGTISVLPSTCLRRQGAARDRRVYFQNGVLNVTSGDFLPHQMDNNNLGALSVNYNPQATLGEWSDHIRRLFSGLPDGDDRIALLQEIVGWLLITDDLNVQKCVAFDGATRAGKGVIFEALRQILGSEKCGFANFDSMANGKTQSLFRRHDVLLDFEAKAPPRQETKQAIGFLNKVASNEPVSIQLLNTQTPWTGRLNAKFMIACNGVPVMVDDSGANSARFLVLRFDRSFEGQEDKEIGSRMSECLEGIAAWGIIGLQRLIANGGKFTQPESSKYALDDLRDGNQPLKEFLRDFCVVGSGERCHFTDLWAAYRIFAIESNIKLSGKHAFGRSLRMTLLGSTVEEKRSLRINEKVSRGFEGLALKNGVTNNVVVGAFGKQEGK